MVLKWEKSFYYPKKINLFAKRPNKCLFLKINKKSLFSLQNQFKPFLLNFQGIKNIQYQKNLIFVNQTDINYLAIKSLSFIMLYSNINTKFVIK